MLYISGISLQQEIKMTEKKVMVGGWLEEEDRDNFKTLCARNKITMSAYFEAFVRAKLGSPESLQRIDRMVRVKEKLRAEK